MISIGVKEWLEQLCGGHKFGSGGAYSNNNNLSVNLDDDVEVHMTDGKIVSLPAGCRVGIYRPYKPKGDSIVAAAFRPDDQVVIREGGHAGIGTYRDRIDAVTYTTVMAYVR